MKYCGVVTDRNCFVKNGVEDALDRCLENVRTYQQRRIFSDEVPMAGYNYFRFLETLKGKHLSTNQEEAK